MIRLTLALSLLASPVFAGGPVARATDPIHVVQSPNSCKVGAFGLCWYSPPGHMYELDGKYCHSCDVGPETWRKHTRGNQTFGVDWGTKTVRELSTSKELWRLK